MTLYEEVRAALSESGLRPRKRFGQNFLIHERVIDAILDLLALSSGDRVLEIGPGLGFLTRRLVQLASKVWAVELDRGLSERLRNGPLGILDNFELIEGDILTVPLDGRLPKEKIKLVGNLPYNISTPVLFRLFELRAHFSCLILMLQKEVADRLASEPGKKDYGTLSVWRQLHGRITAKVAVSPEAFFPRPKVRSTIIKMELYSELAIESQETPALRALVRAAFGQRRKTLGHVLTAWLKQDRREIESLLTAQHIDPKRRGETLSLAEFIELARALRARHVFDANQLPATV